MMRNNIFNIFGMGKWPRSASLASLLAIPLYYVGFLCISHAVYINLILFGIILFCSMVELHRNSAYARKDSKEVVVDELLGMHISLIIAYTTNLLWIALLFFVFRVFDGFKILSANIVDQRLKGKYGLLWDDIAISASAGIIFRLISEWKQTSVFL